MAFDSYPHVGKATTDVEYSQLFTPSVNSGVRDLSSFKVTANGSAMAVSVAPGFMHVRGHGFKSDSIETVSIDEGDAQPRIDVIVARLDYSASPQIQLAVVKGVPSATPVAPTLSQSSTGVFEVLLALVNVPANAVVVNAGNIDLSKTKTVAENMLEYLINESTATTARNALGLGKVAVDDIVPISRGGTGGNSAATARAALGLKSGAIRNISHGTGNPSGGADGDVYFQIVS